MKKVAVIPGMVAGKQVTRRLRKALKRSGYKVVSHTASADVVLAHSAGCVWAAKLKASQIIVLVDPLYWPGRTIWERVRNRADSNSRFRERHIPFPYWLSRQLWGFFYAFAALPRNIYMMRHMGQFDLEQLVKQHSKLVIVRNELDDWLTTDLDRLRQINPDLRIVELPGDHDDFNYNPEPYVNLLQSLV